MHFQPYWIALIAIPFLLRALTTSVRGKCARSKDGKLVFGAPGLAGLCFMGILLGAAILAGGWTQDSRAATTVIGVGMIVSGLLLWPPTLTLDDNGLKAAYVWRMPKRLAYTEVDFAIRSFGEIQVVGNGTEILHTKYHVDPGRFEAELRRHGVER